MEKSLKEIIDDVNLRFKSGNDIPVQRAAIRVEEWKLIVKVLTECGKLGSKN